jgi:hypothetical protein
MDPKPPKYNQVKGIINISVDDISPHPQSSHRCLQWCHKLVDMYPDIKISLFVPTAYWRTIPIKDWDTSTPQPLSLIDSPELCDVLRRLNPKNFEVCYHGMYHGIPGESNNYEFKNLTVEETKIRLDDMMRPVKQVGLQDVFKKILRPPSWFMSGDAIIAAQEMGFEYISLAPEKKIRKFYETKDKDYDNITYYNICPPYVPYPKDIYYKNTIVFHACEWSENYLNKANFTALTKFLETNKHRISYEFTENMVTTSRHAFMSLDERRKRVRIAEEENHGNEAETAREPDHQEPS